MLTEYVFLPPGRELAEGCSRPWFVGERVDFCESLLQSALGQSLRLVFLERADYLAPLDSVDGAVGPDDILPPLGDPLLDAFPTQNQVSALVSPARHLFEFLSLDGRAGVRLGEHSTRIGGGRHKELRRTVKIMRVSATPLIPAAI